MNVKYESKITEVGDMTQEFLENTSSFVLMNEGIHQGLSDMVIRHTVENLKENIVEGDFIKIGRTEMKVLTVGTEVNKNFSEEGHCTIVVNAEATMPGQIAVKSDIPPRLRIGNEVLIYSK